METEHIEPAVTAEGNLLSRVPRSTKYAVIACAVVLLVGVVYFAYDRYYNDPQTKARRDAERVVAAVGKLMVLPEEKPVIATVADPSQLADQPFFQNARKGDKVLIFNTAKKAILYSPSLDKVVDVAPLSIGSPAPAPKK